MGLELHLHRAGETGWRPPERAATLPKTNGGTPIMLPFDALEARLGWSPQMSRHPGAMAVTTALLPETSTYYADLGPAAAASYRLADGSREFGVIERKVLAAHDTYHFIYPDGVATAMSLAGGSAVIVLPPRVRGISFAVWAQGERLIDVSFNWEVGLAEARDILASVVPAA